MAQALLVLAAQVYRRSLVTVDTAGPGTMFGDASDGFHRLIKPVCTWAGKLPKEVA